jgi:ribosome-associated toxin RatA of RatAB toxin-antitoxin module
LRAALAFTIAILLATPAVAETVEATASAHVTASPEHVLAVLADFESWHRVFSSVETVRAERQDAHRARVRQRVHRAGLTLAYTLAATVDPAARRVELVLDRDEPTDMEMLVTSWCVSPHPDGGSTIELRVVTRMRFPLPGFLERHVTQTTARDSVAELARALERSAISTASRDSI